MFKILKKIKELELRVSELEKALEALSAPRREDKNLSSYEEVIDQWLNGTRQ